MTQLDFSGSRRYIDRTSLKVRWGTIKAGAEHLRMIHMCPVSCGVSCMTVLWDKTQITSEYGTEKKFSVLNVADFADTPIPPCLGIWC